MNVLAELRANPKLSTTFATAFVFFVFIMGLLLAWRDGIALLSALVGFALGWAVGILLAPYKEEEKRFAKLSKGIAAFITGYLAARVDRIFDAMLKATDGRPLILEAHFARNIWMALACFIVTMVTVFVSRSYWQIDMISCERPDLNISRISTLISGFLVACCP